MAEQITLVYVDADGASVHLVVPWGEHSGNIPPPAVVFRTRDGDRVFAYAGLWDRHVDHR